jgi:hypothetical protein
MPQKPANNNVSHLNKRQITGHRHLFKKQKKPSPFGHKTSNIKTTNNVKLAKIKESTIKKNIFKIKVTIKTTNTGIRIKIESGIKEEKEIRRVIVVETTAV